MPTLQELFSGAPAGQVAKEPNPTKTVPPGSSAFGAPKAMDISDQLAGDTLTVALKKLKANVDPMQFIRTLQHDPQTGIYTGDLQGQQLFLRNVARPSTSGVESPVTPDTLMVIPRAEADRIRAGQQQPSLLGQGVGAAPAAPGG